MEKLRFQALPGVPGFPTDSWLALSPIRRRTKNPETSMSFQHVGKSENYFPECFPDGEKKLVKNLDIWVLGLTPTSLDPIHVHIGKVQT